MELRSKHHGISLCGSPLPQELERVPFFNVSCQSRLSPLHSPSSSTSEPYAGESFLQVSSYSSFFPSRTYYIHSYFILSLSTDCFCTRVVHAVCVRRMWLHRHKERKSKRARERERNLPYSSRDEPVSIRDPAWPPLFRC